MNRQQYVIIWINRHVIFTNLLPKKFVYIWYCCSKIMFPRTSVFLHVFCGQGHPENNKIIIKLWKIENSIQNVKLVFVSKHLKMIFIITEFGVPLQEHRLEHNSWNRPRAQLQKCSERKLVGGLDGCVLISPPTHNSPCPRLISPPFQIRGPYFPQFFGFRGPYLPQYF